MFQALYLTHEYNTVLYSCGFSLIFLLLFSCFLFLDPKFKRLRCLMPWRSGYSQWQSCMLRVNNFFFLYFESAFLLWNSSNNLSMKRNSWPKFDFYLDFNYGIVLRLLGKLTDIWIWDRIEFSRRGIYVVIYYLV